MCLKVGFKDWEKINFANVVWERVSKTSWQLSESSNWGLTEDGGGGGSQSGVEQVVTMCRRSVRYRGAGLWRDLKVRRWILELMQYFTGSSRRTGFIYFTEGGQEQACVTGLFPSKGSSSSPTSPSACKRGRWHYKTPKNIHVNA